VPRDVNDPITPEAQAAIERILAARVEAEIVERVAQAQPTHNPDIDATPTHLFEVPATPEVEEAGLYQRQAAIPGLYPGTSVSLVGCGGVGVWVALSLALAGVGRIDLYDGDTLSLHNLNRYPLPQSFVGEAKSLALAQWLSLLRPEGEFNARGEFNPDLHYNNILNWVVCATDSLASRLMAHKAATAFGASYLEVGADGEGWSLSPTPPEFSTDLEEVAGYQVTPVHVGPCMMAGAAAAYYILHGRTPVDSHLGRWNGQSLRMESRSEENYPTVTCQFCGWRVMRDGGLIGMIKHVRDERGMGLVEAKALVDKWFGVDLLPPEELEDDYEPEVEEIEEIAEMPIEVEMEDANE
jgi:hypothetical protein